MKKLTGYEREKYLAELLGVRAVPFSGSRFQSGREDLEDENRLFQVKSTGTNKITVDYRDLFTLMKHAQSKKPVFVLDFIAPKLPELPGFMPEAVWVAVRLEDYERLYAALDFMQRFLAEG